MLDEPPLAYRRLRVQRTVLWTVFGVLLFCALVLVLPLEENWRAARLLAKTEKELRRSGEQLDFRKFVPPPVPGAQNFAAAPVVAKLLRLAKSNAAKSDPEGQRLEAMNLARGKDHRTTPSQGSVALGEKVDFAKWNQYLNGAPNEESEPGIAAEKVLQ